MKRVIISVIALFLCLTMWAIPAKPGQRRTIRLADGKETVATLCGDEHAHFWLGDDGQCYIETDDNKGFTPVALQTLQERAAKRRATLRRNQRLQPRRVTMGTRTHYTGTKKGIVILVQFSDVMFSKPDPLALYQRILNEEGYREGKFKGSAADYFKEQSNGQFKLVFDVVGPYALSREQSYYGSNDRNGEDKHADEMIIEACQLADGEVDFADYDWDGDGEADQVYVLYAGKGEADGGGVRTIWPHMWTLTEARNETLTLDSITIDTYACSNELTPSNQLSGIGTFCHEFSHCMGFPDFYDTSYSGWTGMGSLDLMCSGSYNGDSFLPAGYTAHEKMMCGWKEPIVLGETDLQVDSLLPMYMDGSTYIIYNDAYPDEYFMIENRQKGGFDASYPGRGLLITHVDFDQELWECNCPNTKITAQSSDHIELGYPLNDHQRMAPVPADNRLNEYSVGTDMYPYGTLDSLSSHSTPVATLYNNNLKGTKTVEWAITDIVQHDNGTMSFRYRAPSKNEEEPTGIRSVTTESQPGHQYFTLSGQRVAKATKGIYLRNGKKYIFR